MRIAAIVLAAGMSTRMGSLKQLLPWKNGTILGSTIDLYTGGMIDKTIVVVGYCAAEILNFLEGKPVEWVINEDYQTGMASSLRKGISALGDETDACLIGLGDTPLLNRATIASIIKAYKNYQNKIVVPFYKGKKGHPILITKDFFPELLAVQGDIGARTVLKNHWEEVLRLDVEDAGVIIDLDTPESYQNYYCLFGS